MVEPIDNSVLKRGRPPLPAGEARSSRVVTLVTREEIDQLRVLSENTGESISAICYRFIRDALKYSSATGNREER